MSATQHFTELFARKVADYLDKARALNQFDELYLIAPPRFLGLFTGAGRNPKRVRDSLTKISPGSTCASWRPT